jgi:hypothetical protein
MIDRQQEVFGLGWTFSILWASATFELEARIFVGWAKQEDVAGVHHCPVGFVAMRRPDRRSVGLCLRNLD